MVDSFSILLSHGLIAFALWRLLARPDLDEESGSWTEPPAIADPAPPRATGWGARDA
jgi:hypothetical protein